MKNTNSTILILICFLYSCTPKNNREILLPELAKAESLMYNQPDSALSILETMAMPAPSEKLQNATWSLLLVQARDKNHIAHYSDSLVNVAYDYFMKQDDPWRKALVLNYEGRVNEDMEEIEKATRFYLEGCDIAQQTDDYKLRFLLTSNLGTIYLYRSLYKEALEAYTEAKTLAQKMNDPGYFSTACSYLGRAYGVTGRWDEAVSSYKKAIEKAELANDKIELSRALGELAAIYRELGEYDSAFVYVRKDLALVEEYGLKGIAQTYFGIGTLYSRLEVYDSAQIYLNKSLLVANNVYTKKSIYSELSEIAEKQGDMKAAFNYLQLFQNMQDAIQQQSSQQVIVKLQARYNYEKLKNEKVQLLSEKEKIIKTYLCILFVLFLAISGIIYVYQRKLLNKERKLREKKEQLEYDAIQLYENEEEIRENKNQIRILTRSLEESANREREQKLELEQLYEQNKCIVREQKEQLARNAIQENSNEEKIRNIKSRILILQNSLEKSSGKGAEYKQKIERLYKENKQLESKNLDLHKSMEESVLMQQKNELMQEYNKLASENKELSDQAQCLFEKLEKQIPILNELREKPVCITEQQWMQIEEAVKLLYGDFTERLKKYIPDINQNDIRFCRLIKLRFSNAAIANMTMVVPAAVTKHKQRLKKQLPDELKGKFTECHSFEQWLLKL